MPPPPPDSPASPRVLLIEDDAGLTLMLGDLFRAAGYAVECVSNGTLGLIRIAEGAFDLVILDILLPDIDGFEVCQTARGAGVTTPILILSARSAAEDKVRGLRLGADDYLTKPFNSAELLARAHSLIRRRAAMIPQKTTHRFGALRANLKTGQVFRDGQRVALSEREFAVLRYLIERAGQVVSREQLLLGVWAYGIAPRTRTVDMHIATLRQKLERDPGNPEFILTVHSQGYRLIG